MKIALIAGCSANVAEEVKAAKELVKPDIVIGVNDYVVSNAADYLASYHLERIEGWKQDRKASGLPNLKGIYTSNRRPILAGMNMDKITRVDPWGGSSAMIAVQAALELGADRIILAGVPLVEEAGRYDSKASWPGAMAYRKYWEAKYDVLKDKVRSMSGWTKDMFKAPDEAFVGKTKKTEEPSE